MQTSRKNKSSLTFMGSALLQKTSVACLQDLQALQGEHDSLFHADIANRSKSKRIRHYALHFAKYSGQLSGLNDVSMIDFEKIFLDIVIISLAALNALGAEISTPLLRDSITEVGVTMKAKGFRFEKYFSSNMARIIKSCEGFEHGENIDYDRESKESVCNILALCLMHALHCEIDIDSGVRLKWAQIEAKSRQGYDFKKNIKNRHFF